MENSSLNIVEELFRAQPKSTLYQVPGVDMEDAKFVSDVPLDMLDPWPGNRAILEEHVNELMGSIEREGLHQSLLVRPEAYGRYQILAGHHRAEALKRLHDAHPDDKRFATVHVLVKELDDDMAALAVNSTNRFAYAAGDSITRATIEAPVLEEARRMKAGDPSRFKGMRVRDIASELMNSAGMKTSPAQIARNQRELQEAKDTRYQVDTGDLIPQWRHELKSKNISSKQAEKLERYDDNTQRLLWRMWSGQGNCRKEYLDLILDGQDSGKRDARGKKAEAQIKKLVGELKVLRNFGYEPDINLTWV